MDREKKVLKNESNVVVIGSGLSAIGAIKCLIDLGIKPTVLDVGDIIGDEKKELVNKLSSTTPKNWTSVDRDILIKNNSINEKTAIPKKLVFGSDYFYGYSKPNALVHSEGAMPPFSYAKGGLSAGWGAAILPPSKHDIKDWPIEIEEIHKYCQIILKDLPYSSCDDGLNLSFPRMSDDISKLKLSVRSSLLLEKLKSKVKLLKDNTLYGQARLLVNTTKEGCQYCGECMSGCVYKSIYKSDDDITKLISENKIEYVKGCLVDTLVQNNSEVKVQYFDEENKKKEKIFDKVFLAAGAINSSRIILKSLEKFDTTLTVKTRGGFVVPVFSFRRLNIDWPIVNTQPSLFLEFRGDGLEHWVHTQVASDNELLLKMLGLRHKSKGIISKIKNYVAAHTYLLLMNYHSDHSGTYNVRLKKQSNVLQVKHNKRFPQLKILVISWWKLLKILLKIGSLPMYPFAKLNSGSYHVGGTIPMKKNPKKLESNIVGEVKGLKNVHIVDTSTFPSLPGTTIGLVMMANAYRVVDKVFNKKETEC